MDHSNHINHIMSTATTTAALALETALTTTKTPSMDHMTQIPGTCHISMLWNWFVIDSCFLSSTWHVRTQAQFAGSCIGVVLICIGLELVRRLQREYDRAIVREWDAKMREAGDRDVESTVSAEKGGALVLGKGVWAPLVFRPSLVQQAVRAGLYVVQFTAAYIVMLLAMYYNGYIIISIMIGVFIGHYIFGYDNIVIGGKQETGTSCC